MKPIKPKLRAEREHSRCRVFSTNFPTGFTDNPDIKCFVPWEDYLKLINKYVKLFKRYGRK
jgi:hypothetical protein